MLSVAYFPLSINFFFTYLKMPRLVLNEKDMVNIIKERSRGVMIKDLASTYHVNRKTIQRRLKRVDDQGYQNGSKRE